MNDELRVASLFDYDGPGFECEISAVVASQSDVVGGRDMVGGYGRMVGDLFGD